MPSRKRGVDSGAGASYPPAMRLLIAFAALLYASAAAAQRAEDEPTAAPGSIAYGMIENANAEGVFELVHNGQVSVRHVGSGMRCDFERDGVRGSLWLFPGLPRGDDVGCHWQDPGNVNTAFYATRFAQPQTTAHHIEELEAHMRERGWAPRRLPTPPLLVAGAPEIAFQNFVYTMGQHQWFTSIAVMQMGAWTIRLRYSRPAADAQAIRDAEALVPLLFSGAFIEIREAQP